MSTAQQNKIVNWQNDIKVNNFVPAWGKQPLHVKNTQNLDENWISRLWVWIADRCFFDRGQWNTTGCQVTAGHHGYIADRRNARIIQTVWIQC